MIYLLADNPPSIRSSQARYKAN